MHVYGSVYVHIYSWFRGWVKGGVSRTCRGPSRRVLNTGVTGLGSVCPKPATHCHSIVIVEWGSRTSKCWLCPGGWEMVIKRRSHRMEARRGWDRPGTVNGQLSCRTPSVDGSRQLVSATPPDLEGVPSVGLVTSASNTRSISRHRPRLARASNAVTEPRTPQRSNCYCHAGAWQSSVTSGRG